MTPALPSGLVRVDDEPTATDRDVVEACLETCWRVDPAEARMVLIPNTLELKTLWVTRPLADEVERHPHLAFETDFRPIPFDSDETLDQEGLFPESVRGRRAAGAAYAAH